jgi:hypothetical protein
MKRTQSDPKLDRAGPVSRVLVRLERVVDRGYGQFFARCPAHDDTSPSLSIKVLDDGRVLLHCFAGCAIDGVLSAMRLKLSDLYPNVPTPARPASIRWNYHDLLLLARREIQVAVIAAAHLSDGQPINQTDRDRLLAAHARLVKLLEVVNE